MGIGVLDQNLAMNSADIDCISISSGSDGAEPAYDGDVPDENVAESSCQGNGAVSSSNTGGAIVAPLGYIGIVKRFSDRNGWGTFTNSKPAHFDPNNKKFELEKDVRFYIADREKHGLEVGDVVTFRAIPDDDAPTWLKAVDICRKEGGPLKYGLEPLKAKEEKKSEGKQQEKVPASGKKGGKERADGRERAEGKEKRSQPKTKERASKIADKVPPDYEFSPGPKAPRPITTSIVARRLVHTHLEMRLSTEHRMEERAFWGLPPAPVRAAKEKDLELESCALLQLVAQSLPIGDSDDDVLACEGPDDIVEPSSGSALLGTSAVDTSAQDGSRNDLLPKQSFYSQSSTAPTSGQESVANPTARRPQEPASTRLFSSALKGAAGHRRGQSGTDGQAVRAEVPEGPEGLATVGARHVDAHEGSVHGARGGAADVAADVSVGANPSAFSQALHDAGDASTGNAVGSRSAPRDRSVPQDGMKSRLFSSALRGANGKPPAADEPRLPTSPASDGAEHSGHWRPKLADTCVLRRVELRLDPLPREEPELEASPLEDRVGRWRPKIDDLTSRRGEPTPEPVLQRAPDAEMIGRWRRVYAADNGSAGGAQAEEAFAHQPSPAAESLGRGRPKEVQARETPRQLSPALSDGRNTRQGGAGKSRLFSSALKAVQA